MPQIDRALPVPLDAMYTGPPISLQSIDRGNPMALKVRRVITGHKADGKATVLIDEIATNVRDTRPGASAAVIWTSQGFPIDNDGSDDANAGAKGTYIDNGVVFRVISFAPGVTPRNHRTDSTDFAVVISGEIDMPIDDEVVTLRAGDVLVQRGTIHNWVNNGTVPCVIAFTLVSAKSVTAGGKVLQAQG